MQQTGKSSKAMVVVGLVVCAALAAGVAWYLLRVKPGGDAEAMAARLPSEVMLLAWSTTVDDALASTAGVGLTGDLLARISPDFERIRAKLGFDPLSAEGLRQIGIDTAGRPFFAAIAGTSLRMLGMVFVPMQTGRSGIEAVKTVLLNLQETGLVLEEATEGGRPVAWLKTGKMDPAMGSLVDVEGGTFVVFPADPGVRNADEVAPDIRSLTQKLATSDGARLNSVDGFADSVAGSDGALLGVYFNPLGARPFLAGDKEFAVVVSALSDLAGASFFVREEGKALLLAARSVAREAGKGMFLRERDTSVAGKIPGSALVGLHFAVDSELAFKEIEKGLAMDSGVWDDYRDGKNEALQFLELPPGTEPYHLWNGELGFFLGDIAPNPELVARTIVAFAGVAEMQKVKSLVDSLVFKFGAGGLISAQKIAASDAYRITFQGLNMGLMLHDGRVWFAGDWGNLEKIQKGEPGGIFSTERGAHVASVMKDAGSLAMFVDLEKPIALLPTLLGHHERAALEPVWPLLSKLDFLTYEASQDGRVGSATFRIVLNAEGFRKALTDTIGPQLTGALEKERRKAMTTEPIDMLDKLYKGAAMYYSTPRVDSETGEKLPCQFPTSVGPTPAAACCAARGGPDADNDGLCDPQPGAWDNPIWAALYFQIYEPHRCVYSFESNGQTGVDAQFTATANCDLDCDGVMSTFQRYGKGDPQSSSFECSVVPTAPLFVYEEFE